MKQFRLSQPICCQLTHVPTSLQYMKASLDEHTGLVSHNAVSAKQRNRILKRFDLSYTVISFEVTLKCLVEWRER